MKIILTGGGTMGHITPLLSFKKQLDVLGEHQFYYLGNMHRIEKEVAEKNGISFFHVRSQGTGNMAGIGKKLEFINENVLGTMDAARIFKVIKPDLVISTGGFVTAPVLAAAQVMRVPYFIHEQNRVLGKVNKLFLMNAREVYYTFENTLGGQSKRAGKTFGNPVENFNLSGTGEKVLFLGGSGGADYINSLGLAYAEQHPEQQVVLQSGEARKARTEAQKKDKGLTNVEVIAFSDMKELMEQSKFIVSRAGSSTVCELIENEKPALVIPFKKSADNHQVENARYLIENEMGWMMEEETDTSQVIKKIHELDKAEKIAKAKEKMKEQKKSDVAGKIIEDLLEKIKK